MPMMMAVVYAKRYMCFVNICSAAIIGIDVGTRRKNMHRLGAASGGGQLLRMKSPPSSRRQSANDAKSYGGGEGSWFWILLWSGRSPW